METEMPKIGGITIERLASNKNDVSHAKQAPGSESDNLEDDDEDYDGETNAGSLPPYLPPGVTIEKTKPNLIVRPNVQLPAGIQFERRNKQDPSSSFPPKMLSEILDKRGNGAPRMAQPFQPENLIKNLMKEQSVVEIHSDPEEDESKSKIRKKMVLPSIQLPPGISFEKKPIQSFNEGSADAESLQVKEEAFTDDDDDDDDEDNKPDPIDFESLISNPALETKSDSDDKDVVKDLVEMMTKGEIEGEIEEEVDKKNLKRKVEDEDDDDDDDDDDDEDEEDDESSAKKKKLDDDEEDEVMDKSKVSSSHLRKNIREVMDETKLDETTIAAQRQEAERLKRLQEQQRMLRERQSQNVLSLIRQNAETSILKKTMSGSSVTVKEEPNQILLKMGNGQETSLSEKMREMLKTPKHEDDIGKNLLKQVSSSVTIAPIKRESNDLKNDVVTLSSDSDDDCVVISEQEAVPETDEDPANSGMHTSDKYNVPDEQGRVLVNTGHPADEPDVFLAPQIARVIKPHQVGGIRFLYDNIIESQSRYDSSTGFGCILAHSMGLGKTLQIVTFSDIFLRHTSGRKILCIMPINTIQNWFAEYNMWLPRDNPNGADIRCRNFDIYVINESSKNIQSRGKVILDWHKNGGVLLMGYELFRLLSLRKTIKSKRKRPDDADDERNRVLVEEIYSALVKPGPDLVICDEGHRIKNSHATTSQALKNIQTLRRIVLTGYPLQNNLLEYWCMVDFVRPNYLGSKTEFSNMFERPIQNGQCIDSTPQDKRLMRYRAHVLHSLLEGFVQRRSHAVLQEALPQKQEYVLLLRFTEFQKKLYDTFMNDVVRTTTVPNPLKAFAVCCKIWNHPDVLFHFLKKKGEERDLDLEEPLPPSRIPMDFSNPSNPWPKKGPGSRGGKTRQRKGVIAHTNQIAQSSEKPAMEQPLPSISQFTFKPNFNHTADSSNYPVGPNFQQMYQQPDNFPYQRGFNNQFGNHSPKNAKNYPNQEGGFFKNQESFSNSGQQQYFQQNEPGFDFNQRPNDLQNDFSAYPDQQFDNPGFSSSSSNNSHNFWPNSNWPNTSQSGFSAASSSDEFISPKFTNTDKDKKEAVMDFAGAFANDSESKRDPEEKREEKHDVKKDTDLPFDWATELFKNYVTGVIENSSKMEIFFLILTETILKSDRLLVFSQSLLTLDLIEDYLQKRNVPGREERWCKNKNYFRLDGSTPALEREKLINEFNTKSNVGIFLVSTRAGSLGINLVGANRVIVFDASWNPCHDTQAVCRVYRYGQQKPCFVYRLVMDCCLEKKIYDRQINKQGMADRVVDELNPDAHLSLKEATNLCWDDQHETTVQDFSYLQDKYSDDIVKRMLTHHSPLLSKAPFQHESLLIDRKEKKLSLAEKRLAKRGYELEKQAANQPRNVYQFYQSSPSMRGMINKPVASVKPMQSERHPMMPHQSKWIPAEVWQKQGMSVQEMTLPLDVVIPTSNAQDKRPIVLNAGQKVLVLRSHKGVYMQLESGKIIAIRSAKTGQAEDKPEDKKTSVLTNALKNNPSLTVTPKTPPPKPGPFFNEKRGSLSVASVKARLNMNKSQRIPPTFQNTDKKPDDAKEGSELQPQPQPQLQPKPDPERLNRSWPGTSRDLAKESLDNLSSLAEGAASQDKPSKDGPDAAWAKQNYPADSYGNFYPGYSRYPGYPMPGYEPYPYPHPRGYPPNKAEADASGAPPMYPPYPAPYPYPFNYPPHPSPSPHGQQKASESAADPPPVPVPVPMGHQPPYPRPSPPGYYQNFYGPNYPGYYNPYMGPPPPRYNFPENNTQPDPLPREGSQ